MQNIKIKTHAKINLCLDIVDRRPDGYHNLKTIMQSLDLYDELSISKSAEISVKCEQRLVPQDSDNLAYKAAKAIFQAAGATAVGAEININKQIPVAAGLGGGSANAAGTLLGLNFLYGFNFSIHQLVEMSKNIGADVPYCVIGGTVLATGIGEKLELLPPLGKLYIVLVKPDVSINTGEVYQKVKLDSLANRPRVEQAVKAIGEEDFFSLFNSMGNVLEPITSVMVPEVVEIKRKMLYLGANVAQMCGSGPTVFAACINKDKADNIYRQFKKDFSQVFLCQTR